MKSILVLLLCCPMFVSALDIENLDTDIQEVWSGGYWSHQENEGTYRFIVTGGGIEHYKTQLFVQWISMGTDSSKPEIVSSIGIAQLNQDPIFAFGLPQCVNSIGCGSLRLDASNTYDLSQYEIRIELLTPGTYSYASKAL